MKNAHDAFYVVIGKHDRFLVSSQSSFFSSSSSSSFFFVSIRLHMHYCEFMQIIQKHIDFDEER